MTKLIVTSGLAGSDKTEWERPDIVTVSRDELRGLSSDEEFITRLKTDVIVRALREGRDVVVSNPYLGHKWLNRYESLAGQMGADFEIHDTHYYSTEGLTGRNAGWGKVEPIEFDPEAEPVYVFDIDGTLADHTGLRDPYDYSRVYLDRTIEATKWLPEAVSGHDPVVFLSGRSEDCRKETEDWLYNNVGTPFRSLRMRPSGDDRPDWRVKYELMLGLKADGYRPIAVFDDRHSVLRMWETVGVFTFNVGQGKADF